MRFEEPRLTIQKLTLRTSTHSTALSHAHWRQSSKSNESNHSTTSRLVVTTPWARATLIELRSASTMVRVVSACWVWRDMWGQC